MGDTKNHLIHRPREGYVIRIKKIFIVLLLWGSFFQGLSARTITSMAYPVKVEITYDDGIPEDIRNYCDEIGAEFGICPELLESIAYQESRFIPDVITNNYYGLMQVNVIIHKKRIEKYGYDADDMLTAYPCITVAADYLAELFDTYGDDDPIILLLYSGSGWDAVELYKENGFMTQYVEDVLARSAEYERIHCK